LLKEAGTVEMLQGSLMPSLTLPSLSGVSREAEARRSLRVFFLVEEEEKDNRFRRRRSSSVFD
jgi:hypothetical protein